jgi:hypothetical protein
MSDENENWDNDFDLGDNFGIVGATPVLETSFVSSTSSAPGSGSADGAESGGVGGGGGGSSSIRSSGSSDGGAEGDWAGTARDAGIGSSLLLPRPSTVNTPATSSEPTQPALPTGQDGTGLVGIAADKSAVESWDDDFDLELSTSDNDDSDDGVSGNAPQPTPKPTPPLAPNAAPSNTVAPTAPDAELVGILADKGQTEAWDDDFDLGSDGSDVDSNAAGGVSEKNDDDGAPLAFSLSMSSVTPGEDNDFGDGGMSDAASGFGSDSDGEDWDKEMGFGGDGNGNDDSSSSSESDWDADFASDTEATDTTSPAPKTRGGGGDNESNQFKNQLAMFRGLIRDEQAVINEDDDEVPSRYRLLDHIKRAAENKVTTYPQACKTYSLTSLQGFPRRWGQQNLCDWLSGKDGIAVNKLQSYVSAGRSKRRQSMHSIHRGGKGSKRIDKLGAGWSDTYLREATALLRKSIAHGRLWLLLTDFFETLFTMRQDDISKEGFAVQWSSAGWNHVFKNALTLLRYAGMSRRVIDATL